MENIKVGDYVTFEYEGSFLTGLVKEIIQSRNDTISYEIVPSAIGLDHFPIIESHKVKKN